MRSSGSKSSSSRSRQRTSSSQFVSPQDYPQHVHSEVRDLGSLTWGLLPVKVTSENYDPGIFSVCK
jgi:hypothetical protein